MTVLCRSNGRHGYYVEFTKDDTHVILVGYAAPNREFVVCIEAEFRINLNFEYKSTYCTSNPKFVATEMEARSKIASPN